MRDEKDRKDIKELEERYKKEMEENEKREKERQEAMNAYANRCKETADELQKLLNNSIRATTDAIGNIDIKGIDDKNPGLREDLLNILRF